MRNFLPLIFLLAALPAAAQPLEEVDPEDVGLSAVRLDRIDAMLSHLVEAGNIPGAVALIVRDGAIAFWEAYGSADVQADRPLERDAIFRIASQTKAITATAVMMLWEEGRFRLDDPISRYIPEFEGPQVLASFNAGDTTWTGEAAAREITIRDLLTHTSGIGYGVIDGDPRFRMMYAKAGITDLFTTEPVTIEESVRKLAALPLHHNPGEAFTYSEGLDVLGYFVEVISGMPFDEFLEVRLFGPLGMEDTAFYLPPEKATRLVTVQHRPNGEDWQAWPVTFYDPAYPVEGARTFFSGGAGLSSTAEDYAVFLQMYLNDGEWKGHRILSRKTIEFMMENQIGDLRPGNHVGLAFGVLSEEGHARGGGGSVGTFEWGGYFNTQYFADPEEGLIGILMKQTQGPVADPSSWMFRQMVFSAVDD